MTDVQRLDIKRSELRSALIADDNMSAEDRESKTTELLDVESKYRTAVTLEATEREKEAPVESRMDDLVSRTELSRFVSAAASRTEIRDGAEYELLQEIKTPAVDELGWICVPWQVLAGPVETEERADVTTSAPSDINRTARAPLARIFGSGISQYLGYSMPSVGYGEQQWSHLSAGGTAKTVTEGTAVESTAATLETVSLTALRSQISYSVSAEAVSKVGPALSQSLRRDMTAALNDLIDTQILTGDNTTTSGVTSPSGLIKDIKPASVTVPTDVATITDFQDAAIDAIDGGLHCATESDVRLLLGTATYKLLAKLADSKSVRHISRFRNEIGGLRSTNKMPAAASNVQDAIAIRTRNLAGNAVAPVWQNLRILVDPYTGGASQTTHFRAAILWNAKTIRTGPWQFLQFKLA